MKLSQNQIDQLTRKVSRQMELEQGRLSFNRVHKNKKAYDRKKDKKKFEKILEY